MLQYFVCASAATLCILPTQTSWYVLLAVACFFPRSILEGLVLKWYDYLFARRFSSISAEPLQIFTTYHSSFQCQLLILIRLFCSEICVTDLT